MNNTLIGISPEYLYLLGEKPIKLTEIHSPYFLVFCQDDKNLNSNRKELLDKINKNSSVDNQLSKIDKIGEIENYRSFSDFNINRRIFKVYSTKSYFVPEISDHLFFNQGFYTAEHDIPYQQRALIDLAATNKAWMFDTKGVKKHLKILVYDIELTEYEEGNNNCPVDIIGYSDFKICFNSKKDLENEEFSFDIVDCPSDWQDIEVLQLISKNSDEEIENLVNFCKKIMDNDIISGHNVLGFDNLILYERINWILKTYQDNLSKEKKEIIKNFVRKYSRPDKSFHFGIRSEVVQIYPSTFDTYLGTRKFYSFLDEFSLKAVAPFLGIKVPGRIILTPSQMKLDDRTLKYNEHDVQEQLGVTLNLIQQSLPLAFTTCMPFDMLLSSGAVNMWDHMSMLRGCVQKKIMPPICRVMSISQVLVRDFKGCRSREDIVKLSKKKKEQLSKEFIRVVKYGNEMPKWMEDPEVIFNENAKDADERINYHMPGGMTIKPDKDASSHFIPWWYVIVADVGAMYPTILKAMNVGADTIKLASKSEEADDWVWLKKLPNSFFNNRNILWRKISNEESFADKGYMLGIKIDEKPGVVNCAMTGIMNMIAKVKKELKDVKKSGNKDELNRLKMMYQSLKGARNAGTHGIISAPFVSGRQFNLWGAAAITTKGQIILADTLNYLKNEGIRVVYGDTDGIYLGCSRSVNSIPDFSRALGVSITNGINDWITNPDKVISSINKCNDKWQRQLKYPDFELEAENHDAMIFVKHKNYLIFDLLNRKIEMNTKGNNFKGSDKANIARKILKKIMVNVLKDNPNWKDEEEARKKIKDDIINETKEILLKLDLSKVEMDDLTLVQSVQPSKRYKPNQDGSMSTFGKRAMALEKVLGYPIKNRIKIKFVVTKRSLPGINNPSKSGVKPIDYMYPVDHLKNISDIDLEWYKKMIENYIQGAFGLSKIEVTEQTGLDEWM